MLEGEDGRFVVTEPVESAANPFAFTLFFPADNKGPLIPPEPYKLHGRYGSHPELSMVDPAPVLRRGWTRDEALINQQVFSPDEMYSIIAAGRVAYLSGAANCLLEYTPDRSSGEQLLLDNIAPNAGNNSLQRRLESGQVKPGNWVWRLAEAGNFKIIRGNPLWGPRSVVYNDWTANYTYAPRSGPPDYVTYGAVFASADEAAQNLHGRVHGRNFLRAVYRGGDACRRRFFPRSVSASTAGCPLLCSQLRRQLMAWHGRLFLLGLAGGVSGGNGDCRHWAVDRLARLHVGSRTACAAIHL